MHRTIVLFALALAACKTAEASPPPTPTPTGHYCNLGVFTPEEHAHLKSLVPKLVAATTTRKELPNGYAFEFSGQFKEAGEWLDSVRRCCPTVEYEVAFAPRGGPASMRITGGAGAKEFIREEFAPLF
jgi:hypothetical protein